MRALGRGGEALGFEFVGELAELVEIDARPEAERMGYGLGRGAATGLRRFSETGTDRSIDGFMQAPGGPQEDPTGGFTLGGWVAPYFDEALGASPGQIFGRPFDLLLGRKSYDIFAALWPYVTDRNDPIAASFNRSATASVL